MSKHLIVAPPPTPNGDLHVGHLSGPYLAADVYKRYLLQHGIVASYALSADDNQSYVDTTAVRLKTTPDALVEKSREEITSTLRSYDIGYDAFGRLDAGYTAFVKGFFQRLYDAKLIAVRDTPVLFDQKLETYPSEAFVSGYCPRCFESSCGGICEACGHPNRGFDLLGIDGSRYTVESQPRLVLDMEALRPELARELGAMTHRSALAGLVSDLLSRDLAPFTLSYRTGRGIPVDFAGLPDQQLNVWGEMYPAHHYFLERLAGPLRSSDRYHQFIGFDNSYFYVFVHLALGLLGRRVGFDWPLPSAFVTNQFYNLGAHKFSTSRGHLVWARDLAREFNSDVIRLYLGLHGPEFQEASFQPGPFSETAKALVARINQSALLFNRTRSARTPDRPIPEALLAPFRELLPPERFSMASLARRSLNGLDHVARLIEGGDLSLVPYVPSLLALCLSPFCPRYVAEVKAAFALDGAGCDGVAAAACDRELPLLRASP
jgi:methionyl-tRNA synthetase